MSQKSF